MISIFTEADPFNLTIYTGFLKLSILYDETEAGYEVQEAAGQCSISSTEGVVNDTTASVVSDGKHSVSLEVLFPLLLDVSCSLFVLTNLSRFV